MAYTPIFTPTQATNHLLYLVGKDYLQIGPCPIDHDTTPPGGDEADQLLECRAYINQILRKGPPPPGASFFILHEVNHIDGPCYDVAVIYEFPADEDEENTDSLKYAYDLESFPHQYWDEEAIRELRRNGHSQFVKQREVA